MMARLVRYDSRGDIEQEFMLQQPTTTVGREIGNIVQIVDPGVSKQHAVIQDKGTSWEVTDTGSRNGVSVNGRRMGKPARLKHGDEIAFGPVRFLFETSQTSDGWSSGLVIDNSPEALDATISHIPAKDSKLRRWLGLDR